MYEKEARPWHVYAVHGGRPHKYLWVGGCKVGLHMAAHAVGHQFKYLGPGTLSEYHQAASLGSAHCIAVFNLAVRENSPNVGRMQGLCVQSR